MLGDGTLTRTRNIEFGLARIRTFGINLDSIRRPLGISSSAPLREWLKARNKAQKWTLCRDYMLKNAEMLAHCPLSRFVLAQLTAGSKHQTWRQ